MRLLFRKEAVQNRSNRLYGKVIVSQSKKIELISLAAYLFAATLIVVFINMNYKRKVQVEGILSPNNGVVVMSIQHTGTIKSVSVKEGDLVLANQSIATLDSEQHSQQGDGLHAEHIKNLQDKLKNIGSIKLQKSQQLETDLSDIKVKLGNVSKQQVKLQQQYALLQKRIKNSEEMVLQLKSLQAEGYISELELQRQNDDILALQQALSDLQFRQLALKNDHNSLENQLHQKPKLVQEEITLLDNQKLDFENQIATYQQLLQHSYRAPRQGVITGIKIRNGDSVSPGQIAAKILPSDSTLEAILYVPSSKFGMLNSGQPVKLQLDAFPYRKFGVQEGVIKDISKHVLFPEEIADVVAIQEPSYRVIVSLNQQTIKVHDKEIRLRSGMTLKASVITDELSLFSWLFDSILVFKGSL